MGEDRRRSPSRAAAGPVMDPGSFVHEDRAGPSVAPRGGRRPRERLPRCRTRRRSAEDVGLQCLLPALRTRHHERHDGVKRQRDRHGLGEQRHRAQAGHGGIPNRGRAGGSDCHIDFLALTGLTRPRRVQPFRFLRRPGIIVLSETRVGLLPTSSGDAATACA